MDYLTQTPDSSPDHSLDTKKSNIKVELKQSDQSKTKENNNVTINLATIHNIFLKLNESSMNLSSN